MNNSRDLIILSSNKLNNVCQALGLVPPKRIELNFAAQIIPSILIGKKHFISPNWLCSKDEKLVRLIDYIISQLNSTVFLQENLEELKATPLVFPEVFCNDSVQPIIKTFTYSFP
jgi:hypothetical protein